MISPILRLEVVPYFQSLADVIVQQNRTLPLFCLDRVCDGCSLTSISVREFVHEIGPCTDDDKMCNESPGFPDEESCALNNYDVANKYCRKMCSTCNGYNKEKINSHLCCEGKTCSKGYVLDTENQTCACTLLCPGPLCGMPFNTN
ncbi:UNVERIFIED_CONTAM: hypothetical protein NCL1_21311 [Trichonephila clavipes]